MFLVECYKICTQRRQKFYRNKQVQQFNQVQEFSSNRLFNPYLQMSFSPRHINCIPGFLRMHAAKSTELLITLEFIYRESPLLLLINYLLIFSGVTTSSHFSSQGPEQTLCTRATALTYFNSICLYLVRKLFSTKVTTLEA